jgi:hypothetical protein
MIAAREEGTAVIVALMATALMAAIAASLVLTTSTEALVAGNFRDSTEAIHAADAAIERAIADLPAVGDWNLVLSGAVQSSFIDGPLGRMRTLPDRTTLDLGQVVNLANCERASACSSDDMNAVTEQRPWGTNNPRWQPYLYGMLADVLPGGSITSRFYVVVLAADDSAENDGDPLRDGTNAENPGSGVLSLHAEAFGPSGAHQVIEATVARSGAAGPPTGVRMVSWRLRR